MKNKKINILIICIFFIISSTLAYSQSDQKGCCTNPGAGDRACFDSSIRLVSKNDECCPLAVNYPEYYRSTQNQNLPADYADCAANFFFAGQACSSSIDSCAAGCCCSGLGGSVKPQAQCQASGLRFYRGQTNCDQLCPSQQCTGTNCGTLNCNDALYAPRLTNLQITPVKGQEKFYLQWTDECQSNSLYYEISRCRGNNCEDYNLITTLKTNSFTDSSDELAFGFNYGYKIKAFYNLQLSNPTINRSALLGDFECAGKTTNGFFCVNNTAYSCNSANKLIQYGTSCQSSSACVVNSNNVVSCIPKSVCNIPGGNPFGMFYTLNNCEKDSANNARYCFYDRSASTADSCFSCMPSMSCYDYRTESACARDNCNVGKCKWKNLPDQLQQIGIGACVSTAEYNCKWCDNKGTSSMENLNSYNNIFDVCTKDKSTALSEENFRCLYSNGKSIRCTNVVCSDYGSEQCSNAKIQHNANNQITNPSSDECRIQVCQNINNVCVKNADGDDNPDCKDRVCEADYFAPNETLIPISRNGVIKNIVIQIYDETSANTSYSLRNSPDYTTFLCVEPCGANGHPYPASTQSRNLLLSNLNLYDGNNGSRLLTLSEGANTIRYYAMDTSKNIGIVQRLAIEAHLNTSSPAVLYFNVTGGNKAGEKLYTNTQQPEITVRFVEPAVITYSKITNVGTGADIPINFGNDLGSSKNTQVSQVLPNGQYKITINAKNRNNILMDIPFSAFFVIDTTNPDFNISPSNNSIINQSLFSVSVAADKEISIISAQITDTAASPRDIKNNFSTSNNKNFAASANLSDGNKLLQITVSDFANNRASKSSNFIVDAYPTRINLLNPRFGVASVYTFNLAVSTDNNAECRFSLDDNLEFNFMYTFTSTGGILHTATNFNLIKDGDNSTHKLIVNCKDSKWGLVSKTFDLSVDTRSPQIITAYAYPNPIVESPISTTLTVESDQYTICKYSASPNSFDSMEGKFDGFDNFTFSNINKHQITVANQGSYTYYVGCVNKAGAVSSVKQINFSADLNQPLRIISHTPELWNTSSIDLAIETNRKTQCKFSETDSTAQSGQLFGSSGYSHTKSLILTSGKHTFYIICKDQYLQQWSDIFTINSTIDTSGPFILFVNDSSTLELFLQKTCNTDKLRVKFLAQDLESGVKDYFYTILQNNQPIIGILNTFTGNQWIWVTNLSLQDVTQYQFSVKARNYAGLTGDSRLSDGINVDTSVCRASPTCGDGILNQPGEECDSSTFGSISSCLNYTNFVGGVLKCTPPGDSGGCKINTSGCTRAPNCGNGQLDPEESCDKNIFGQIKSCTDISNFNGGTIKCSSSCQLDTSGCTALKCGNGIIDSGESCDTKNIGNLTGKCVDYNPSTFTDGNITCSSCNLDTTKCQGIQGACNNGILNIGEACDTNIFGQIKNCTDIPSFSGGTLKCAPITCQLDTTSCTPKPSCGNGAIDIGESCDGNNLGPLSGKCSDYTPDFNGGNILCTNCRLDTTSCSKTPPCGNGRINTGELCDGDNFGNITDLSCSSYNNNFVNGTLTCRSCQISTQNCVSAKPGGTCRDSGTCNINDPCSDKSDCKSGYCFNGLCKQPTCSDNIKNGDETDIDCGGPCGKCQTNKACRVDNDCQSSYCNSGTCKSSDSCNDGKLDGAESDIDCGGACAKKCSASKSCNANEDCDNGLQCISAQCAIATQSVVTAVEPPTGNESTTTEITNATSTVKPETKGKFNLLKVFLVISGIAVLLSGFGFLAYKFIIGRNEEMPDFTTQREMPKIPQQPMRPNLRSPIGQRQTMPIRPAPKNYEEARDTQRKKLFVTFEKEKPKETTTTVITKPEQAQPIEMKAKETKIRKANTKRKSAPKKPKEDVFLKLKEIAKETKKKKS